jgi:hypothetical protein
MVGRGENWSNDRLPESPDHDLDIDLDLDLKSFERLRYTVAKALSLTRQYKA